MARPNSRGQIKVYRAYFIKLLELHPDQRSKRDSPSRGGNADGWGVAVELGGANCSDDGVLRGGWGAEAGEERGVAVAEGDRHARVAVGDGGADLVEGAAVEYNYLKHRSPAVFLNALDINDCFVLFTERSTSPRSPPRRWAGTPTASTLHILLLLRSPLRSGVTVRVRGVDDKARSIAAFV